MNDDNSQLIQERIRELYENSDFISSLFRSLSGYGIIAADFDGNVIAYNEGARQVYGYSPEEMLGKQTIEIFFSRESIGSGKLQEIIDKLLGGEEFSFEGENVKKNGEKFPARITFTLTRDKSGNLVGFVEIVEDITRQKEYEATRKQELREFEVALVHQRSLTGWEEGSITAQMAGVGPLRERAPDVFSSLKKEYGSLMDEYLEALGFNTPPPRRRISELANRIGEIGCGPRDVVDIHMQTVMEKSSNAHPKRARAYTLEGRLLAIELMGNLVDFYRLSKYKREVKI